MVTITATTKLSIRNHACFAAHTFFRRLSGLQVRQVWGSRSLWLLLRWRRRLRLMLVLHLMFVDALMRHPYLLPPLVRLSPCFV